MNRNRVSVPGIAFVVLCGLLSPTSASLAQTPAANPQASVKQAKPKQAPKPFVRKRLPPDPQFKSVIMDKIPDLSGLPSYPDKKMKLITCLSYPQMNSGFCCNFEFFSTEKPEQVMEFYK